MIQVLDLEFNVYRYEKLTEALVDIIQSHDPDFVLEEEEILKSYLDNNKGLYTYEALHEKTNNLAFQTGQTQAGMNSHRSRLEP